MSPNVLMEQFPCAKEMVLDVGTVMANNSRIGPTILDFIVQRKRVQRKRTTQNVV